MTGKRKEKKDNNAASKQRSHNKTRKWCCIWVNLTWQQKWIFYSVLIGKWENILESAKGAAKYTTKYITHAKRLAREEEKEKKQKWIVVEQPKRN